MKRIGLNISLVFLMLTLPVLAEETSGGAGLPGDDERPLRFGVGIDFLTMTQPYSIKSLAFSLPGMDLPAVNTSAVGVENDIQFMDIKLDAWVLPFLNLFAVLGKVDGTTTVDLSSAGLPLPISTISIDLDGTVYGGGATLAVAHSRYFGSLTASLSNTSLKGDFASSLKTVSLQPRAGIFSRKAQVWLGGLYLKTDEQHKGSIPLALGGPAPTPVSFDVTLKDKQGVSPTLGGSYHFNKHFNLTFEAGFGERRPILANLTYRIR